MKLFSKLLLLICILLLIPKNGFSNEGNLYEVGLAEKVDSSNFIFKGRVISQHSKWNQDNNLIVTISTVQVQTVFKGVGAIGSTIYIRTIGGRVGDNILETSSLLNLSQNDFGMFFCNGVDANGIYEVYSSKQGFLKYANSRAIAPFVNEDQKQLEQNISAQTGVYPAGYNLNTTTSLTTLASGGLSFSPSTLSSGTSTEITICGTGFGTTGPDATHYVAFANADNGGAPSYIAPALSSYVSWSDTVIVVNVPTPAGTGPIKVSINGTETYSTDTLTVPYAILNAGNDKIPLLHDMNGSGGLTWNFSTSMTSAAQASFNRALNSWRCATGINWIVSPTPVFISTASATDGFNVVARGTVPAGVLGVCYNYYTSCNGGIDWNLTGQDIIFKSSGSWYYSTGSPASFQTDFESVALHELGHAHLLGHVVENSDVLFYALGAGNTSRVLTYYNIVAGSLIMNLSQGSSPCPISPVVQNFPTGCSAPILTDAWISTSQNTPNNSTCIGPTDIFVNFGNLGIDTVFQVDIHWAVNGIAQSTINWTGVLANGDVISDYLIGNYSVQDSSYLIEVWLDQVNGGQEIQTSNDTITYNFHPVPCFSNEASISNFELIDATTCLSSENIIVDLINSGVNDLTSCWIHYSADGIPQDSILWSGVLSPNDTASSLIIGTQTSFYPSVDISVWLTFPNGVNDPFNSNDTLTQIVTPLTLKGTYTVGGIFSDFNTLSDAAALLNDYGICDDVVLNVKTGNYTDRFVLDSIPSPDPSYIVTIKSEANNRDSVHIHFPFSSFAPNSMMTFDSTRNVIVRDLSLHFDDGGYYEELIEIKNGANNLVFDNLLLDLSDPNYTNNQTGKTGFYVYGNGANYDRPCNNLVFKNNTIEYGAHAFELYNGSPVSNGIFPTGWIIEDNFIKDQNNVSLVVQGGSGTVVKGNTFESSNSSSTNSSSYKQLTFNDCRDSLVVEANHCTYSGNRDLLLLEDCVNSISTPIKIYNNSFNLTSAAYSSDPKAVLQLDNNGYLEIWNNTIHSNAQAYSSSYGYNIQASTCDSISLINNQIVNSNNVGVLHIENSGFYSNYNNLYKNAGSYLSVLNGTNNTSFLAHQTNTGFDLNSFSSNPVFFNSMNLIPTNFALDDLGIPLAAISSDITGAFRDPVTPDVGAYEFGQLDYDIGIPSSSVDSASFCPNSQTSIFVDVKNFGVMSIDSFFIYITINSQPTDSVLIQQTINSGATTQVYVGDYNINQTFNNSIEVKTALPNGVVDQLTANDLINLTLNGKLNGAYTVGNSSSDFIFLNDATDYLNQNGVCGPVTFNVVDGVYNGSMFNEMVIHAYSGMSEANTVTFQSEILDSSLVMFSSTDPVFSLQGVKYMNFKHLGFHPLNANDHAIGLDSCSYITVSNCYFNDGRILDENIFPAGQEGIDNIRIEQSYFEGGAGIYFEGLSAVHADSVSVVGCQFHDFSRVAFEGVSNVSFQENTIDLASSFSWSVPFIDDCSNINISRNHWKYCNSGLYVSDCYPENGGINLISNNFIRARRNPISVYGSDSVYILHNSINQTNNETTSTEYGVFLQDVSSMTFKNNVLHSAYNDPLIYIPNGEIAAFEPDNNIYSNNSDSIVKGTGGSANYYSFLEWQSLGKDTNSLYGNPFFASITDLHVNNLFIADSNAASFAFIMDDFDGDPRDPTHPDIGADEFDLDILTFHDVELQAIVTPDTNNCFQADSIRIAVVNHSIFPIDSFKVNILLFNQLYDSSWIYQTIAPDDTVIINLGDFDFSRNTLYAWSFEIVSPNGAQDNYFLNNTSETEYIFYDVIKITAVENECNGNIGLYIPQFTNASILWSTGSTSESTSISSPGTYSIEVTDAQGCVYTSTIIIN